MEITHVPEKRCGSTVISWQSKYVVIMTEHYSDRHFIGL